MFSDSILKEHDPKRVCHLHGNKTAAAKQPWQCQECLSVFPGFAHPPTLLCSPERMTLLASCHTTTAVFLRTLQINLARQVSCLWQVVSTLPRTLNGLVQLYSGYRARVKRGHVFLSRSGMAGRVRSSLGFIVSRSESRRGRPGHSFRPRLTEACPK